ncbi:FAD-dependent monooxygenase [Nocardia sp. NPDC057272]|uniref:FAD-dependent monooxygenase n=1 Tax=Nocardia sp. NPDC057272 TaxID=3346079 RepID=UPI00362A63BC
MDLLVDTGVSDWVRRVGYQHEGIELAFSNSPRIDCQGLVGAATGLYPQTDVFISLADARRHDDGDIRFGVTDVAVDDLTTNSLALRFTDSDGTGHEIRRFLVGADGSRSLRHREVPSRPAQSVLP